MTRSWRSILSVTAALVLVLSASGCTADAPADPAPVETPVSSELDALADLGAQELVETLEATPVADRRTDLLASVRHDQVLLSTPDGTSELAVPITDGLHYLSIAPYVSDTHDCYYHSLTTCKGELGGQDVSVLIVDDESGEVYVDEAGPTNDNGFIAFWLPADRTATVTVTADGRAGTTTVGTGAEDLTCLTSLQLA